ncbi:relaxase/mobilization nuclease domain-containing protein [Nostoc sp. 'Peltigera membranacea cyanobiont' 232]|uniref:relaxase/mobilization nuclease domain-containing protein n=1 Tax=Nostoc sp. 'Peltigera membranacea cyanobiont' 232 TaxID=2014531 RepID=UPI001CB95E21|nr:relaxase/mobilization nuclease domain-containing protein [Nostoc sp. 'Peltigera membranacea cyanobiont' 232]
MIGKQTKGRGFRKLLDYLESREDAQLIGGNMSGRNARELAREFKLSRQLNSDADRVVYHVSLSAAKGDVLDDEKWSEIGDRYMKEMGFDANQFVIFRHHNTDDDHIHIAASRIRMDTGLLVHDSWDYVRSEKVLRQIEQDYELVQVQGSREKLNRTPSTGQIRRIRREQEEYSLGQRDSLPERTIKEQVQQTIDNASVDNPQMPLFIMRLQVDGISVRTGFTRNGKSKGISYEKDGQAFSGTQLGAAYTFPGLQKHRGVDYQSQRDDARIEHLLNNRVGRTAESQQPINAISDFIEQSVIESALIETLPQLTEQVSQYQQQLEEGRTAFDDLGEAIADVEQQLLSQRAVDAISDFIEQSVVESTLMETLPQLTEQLSQVRQQLEARRTAFDGLDAAITQELQSHTAKRAISSISDYIEQSTVESALTETVLELTQQLSQYKEELITAKATFNDLDAVLATELQSYLEKRAISSISDYIEQSTIESALTETVLELTEQLSQYRQQLLGAKTTFNDFDEALTAELQSHADQKAILSIFDYIEQSAIESALTETVLGLTEQLSQYRQQLLGAKTTFNDFETALTAELQSHADQKAILSIFDYIEQSAIESALTETVLGLTQQVSQYHQQLLEAKTTFNDFETALTAELQSHAEKRAILSISDYIEQSTVESALTEAVLELRQQLSQYKEQLVTAKATFKDLDTVLATELQSYLEKRAISSISDYIEQSTVESALTETVLELTQQISQNQQQLSAGRTIFDDLEAAIVYLEQLHRSQKPVDAVALNKTPTITTDEPKLKDNLSAELYEYYSADLQNLLVTDRDKEIAIRALLDNKPVQDVEEIIFASPAGWTIDEAKALVLIANNQLASNREQKQSSPQFTPPPEDESLRPVLQHFLTQKRGITNFLVHPLQQQGLGYIDQHRNVVFIKRSLNGEKSGALVWDTARLDNRAFKYPDSDRSEGWFHLKLGGEPDDKIERVYLCSSPIDALTMAEIDRDGHKGQPPVRTMYMAVDDPNNLPFELLRNINRIGVAFNNDDQGDQAAQIVQKKLPQAKRIAPSGLTWNEILIEQQQQQQQEMLEQKQRSRGFSR